jgi:nucleolin
LYAKFKANVIFCNDIQQVGGRSAKVNFPEVPKGGERLVMGQKVRNSYRGFVDSPHKIYAGNLGWGLNSQDLRDAFAEQPGLLGAKVIYERDNGRSRGFGFVTFETAEHLEAALNAMNGVVSTVLASYLFCNFKLVFMISRYNYVTSFLANVMQCFQEVQGRPLRLNLAAARTSPSPPVIEENTKNNVEGSELMSSAST